MPRHLSNMVTIVGSAYFQPIADLVERLLRRKPHRPNRVQSGYDEHGFSAAVILLLVAMFESYMSRVRYVRPTVVSSKTRSALNIALSVFPRLRHRVALEEVYVLRDLLMHNHLWEIEYEWGGPVPMVLKKATLHPSYGDKKFNDRVDMKSYRTKALGLAVFPSRVDRRDLLKVFETLWKTLLRFEANDLNQCSVSHQHVRFRGQNITFGSIIDEVRRAL